jgi:tripeptide aminopeptidase
LIISQAAAQKHGAGIEITSSRSYNAYHISDDDTHVTEIKAAFEAIGIEGVTKPTGGGSDANIFNEKGLKTVNFSTGMSKVHTSDEFIAVADLIAITEFVHCYLRR